MNKPMAPRGGMHRGGIPHEKGKPINFKALKRLLSYLKGYIPQFIIVFICIIISTVASVGSSLFLRTLIDDHILPLIGVSSPDFSGLAKALLYMGILYGAGLIAGFAYNVIMAFIAQGTLKRIRDDMFTHMQKLPIKYFDTHKIGDTMSRYTNDTDTLRQLISMGIPQCISSLITIICVFSAMLVNSVWLTIFVVLFLFLVLKITGAISSRSGKYFVKQQKSLGGLNGYIEEMMNGQKVVKVFCHEDAAKKEFDKRNEELCENATNANILANVLMPVMGNMGYFLYVLIAIVGGSLAIFGVTNLSITSGFGVLTLGAIVSFLQLSRNFLMPINQITQQINFIVMALAGAQRIFELMDEEVEEDAGYVALVNAMVDEQGNITETNERTGVWAWRHPHEDSEVTYTLLRGEVVFTEVDFGYTDDKTVLHDISLYAKPGQKVALVGATGAGKTTITNLINRFYSIDDGKIRYDGININKIKKNDLRRSLGIVLQDVNLFTASVMENIRYGNLEATDEECIAAAKLAGAHDFIMLMKDGYDTVLEGDGSGLSQGQRQLLSIARAAVADPPVMILDEATSSIDTRTEAIVQRGMDRLMKGRTVFVIAHRLSTVQNSDVIMVLEDGRIIERGNHDELIAKGGKYYQLYMGAFELE